MTIGILLSNVMITFYIVYSVVTLCIIPFSNILYCLLIEYDRIHSSNTLHISMIFVKLKYVKITQP